MKSSAGNFHGFLASCWVLFVVCLLLFLGGLSPVWAQKPVTVSTISTQQYLVRLETASRRIATLKNKRPRPLGPILDSLDVSLNVRRDDGKIQSVNGNAWSDLKRDLSKPSDVKRQEVLQAEQITQSQIRALNEWTGRPRYASVDAQKMVANLESQGQIRSGPLWWQKALGDAWNALSQAWKSFMDWLNSLLPKTPASTPNIPQPNDRLLWGLFYLFVTAILLAVVWYLFRAFGGKWGRRSVRRDAALEGEDAQLLLLPPTELRSRADEYAAQGNFREALRHRYLALLVQLDTRGVWRYDARRTNWEHIAALRRQENKHVLVSPLSELTRRFDRVRYGGAACDAQQWQQFDADARQFESETNQFEIAGGVR